MKNPEPLDMNLLEEVSDLDFFIVRKPLSSPEFWVEWQEKYGRAVLAKVALKKIAKTKNLSHEEYTKLRAMVEVYEEIIRYLDHLKNTALNLRGILTNYNVETDDDDMDFDF